MAIDISFVITNYNNASTIEKCIESIKKINNINYEIIVVDDASTNNSISILEKIDNIKLLKNEKNRGVSFSRNRGMDYSKGKYISFIDSDDYLDESYSKFMKNFVNDNYDLVVYDILKIKKDRNKIYTNYLNGKITMKDLLHNYPKTYLSGVCSYFVTNKLFSRKVIKKNSIYFDEELSYGEDQDFCSKYFRVIKNVYFINRPLYCYVEGKGLHSNAFKYYAKQMKRIYLNNQLLFKKNNADMFFVNEDIKDLYLKCIKWTKKSNINLFCKWINILKIKRTYRMLRRK